MDNKLITLVLVAVLAIAIGLAVVSKQTREPLLREILRQQSVLVKNHEYFRKVIESEREGDDEDMDDELETVMMKLRTLEVKVRDLENKLSDIETGKVQQRPQRQGPPQEDYSKKYTIPVDHSPLRGPRDAKVTIVKFVDFQCPFCARFYPPIQEILKAYPNDVNFMIKQYPLAFHPQAKVASRAVLAAGVQGKYWEMVDAIMALNASGLNYDKFKEIAGNLGLDVQKFEQDYKEKEAEWEKIIEADMRLGQQIEVRGTPTFYINGKKTRARTFEEYKKEIDEILKGK